LTYPIEIAEFTRPPEDITVSQWAERYRLLIPETSAEPGPWRNIRTPYLNGIMDAFSDPFIERIVFNKGSQIGGTEALLNMMLYAIHQDPAPALVVYPTLELAKYASRKRIRPVIDACPELKAKRPENDDDFTTMEMLFPGMVLTLSGANSPASLASRPCRYVFLDEVNKFPVNSGKEADPISLAMERQKTFWNKKTVIVSTPTTEAGQITIAMQMCDVVYDYHVPCPHCGTFQTLQWKQIKWDRNLDKNDPFYATNVKNSTFYECESCHNTVTDLHRPAMIQGGEWLPREKPPAHIRSKGFHLPSFYSPWLTWGDMSEIFIKSRPYPEQFQNVVNSWWAEPWIPYTQDRKESAIMELKDGRPRGLVPSNGVLGITAGIDTQDNGFYYVVRAWGEFDESWLITEGFIDDYDALLSIVMGRFKSLNGLEYIVNLAFQDAMGHRTAEVYEKLRRIPQVKPTKGEQRMAMPYSVSKLETFPGTNKPIIGGLSLYRINSTHFKDKLHSKLDVSPADPGAFHLHSEVSDDYARQMVSEFRNDKGIWECINNRSNHYWDCETLAMAAADVLGIRHWKAKTQTQEDPPVKQDDASKNKAQWFPERKKSNWFRR